MEKGHCKTGEQQCGCVVVIAFACDCVCVCDRVCVSKCCCVCMGVCNMCMFVHAEASMGWAAHRPPCEARAHGIAEPRS